jgi:hypothetical protein
MDRGSSKHGPQRDDEMERETEDITRTGEPQPGEEWRQTEPFDEPYSVPEDQMPGTPAGITPSDVDRRADRGTILDYARQADAPDDVVDALSRLPARRVFHTIGEVVRAIGIHTEDPRDHADG